MKILVFGGSFDPPHAGHAALLAAAARRIKPDRILVVPAFQAPLKGSPVASPRDRSHMVRIGLLRGLPARWRRVARLELSEARSRRRVYTVETLRRLRRQFPGAELHFAVGSDAAASFASWKEPRRLKALCRWWTAKRPGSPARIPAFFNVLPGRMPDVSATRLRDALEAGEDVSRRLSPAVAAFIEGRGLYGRGLLAELRKSLSPERYRHTLAVSRLAVALARRWELDASRARLAGLLHDCGRAIPVPEMAAYARRRRLAAPDLPGILRRAPLLLHAYISADLARRRFGVTDRAVLSAVRRHTLGDRTMAALDRLLYVADAVSEDRDYPEAAPTRRLAFEDLDEAFRACVLNKIRDALSRGAWLHPLTIALWNSLPD